MTLTITKEQMLKMPVDDLETLLQIIGDLSHPGYRVCMCRIYGKSYNQCAQKLGITKSLAQKYWEKCTRLGYDNQLKRIFDVK